MKENLDLNVACSKRVGQVGPNAFDKNAYNPLIGPKNNDLSGLNSESAEKRTIVKPRWSDISEDQVGSIQCSKNKENEDSQLHSLPRLFQK